MKSAKTLQRDVMDELQFEPSLNAAAIGVAVTEGVVTLTGHVDSYADKLMAERVAKRVSGAKGVANELDVRLPSAQYRDDTDIARAALDAIKWHVSVPDERIKVVVDKGWVTLEGEVDWQFQKNAAESAVRYLIGVKGVNNLVRLKARATPSQVRGQIESALKRRAELHAGGVEVETHDGRVVLTGTVETTAERDEAEDAAWAAPGVTSVENRITIEEYAPVDF